MSKYWDVDLYYYGIPLIMESWAKYTWDFILYNELCKVFYKNKDNSCDKDLWHETSKMSYVTSNNAFYLWIKHYLNEELLKDIFTIFINRKQSSSILSLENSLDIITAVTDIDARELYNSLK